MGSLTREIGAFVAGLGFDSVPDAGLAVVRNGFADFTATVLLGRGDEVTRIVRDTLVGAHESPESRLLFGVERVLGPSAALVNGVASHAQDYDDVGLSGIQPTHPSASIAPAVFAEAEALGRDGKAMTTAYVAAFETWGELATRIKDPIHVKGWHPTGTFGAIAAAAAAASLRGLDGDAAARAVAIAASLSAGVIANFGSMTKPFHAGRAAQSGVVAARLAQAGMTAAPDALESNLGFLRAIAPKGEADLTSPAQFGARWFIESHGLGFKLFPMCYGAHRALDGIFTLLARTPFSADEVESIDVEQTQAQFSNLVHTDPRSALDAKFSMEFAMACAVVARRCTRAEFDESFVNRADVRALMGKVRRRFKNGPDRVGDGLVATLKDGRKLDQRFTYPLGDAQRPAPPEALWTKFADCVSGALDDAGARRMFDMLQNVEKLRSPADLPVARA